MRTPAIALSLAALLSITPSALADNRAPSAARDAAPASPAPAQAPSSPAQSTPTQPAANAPAPAPSNTLAPASRVTGAQPPTTAAIPPTCQPFIKATQSPTPQVAIPARISLASCLAQQSTAPIALCDCGQSIVDLEKAIAPALAILDELIASNDAASQALAEHAKAELYAGLIIRMQATIPRASPTATPAELNLRTVRSQTLDAQLDPWRDAAQDAYARVIDLARQHPEVARNPAVAAALRDSQSRIARDSVATASDEGRTATPLAQ